MLSPFSQSYMYSDVITLTQFQYQEYYRQTYDLMTGPKARDYSRVGKKFNDYSYCRVNTYNKRQKSLIL